MKPEPTVTYAWIRESSDDAGYLEWAIECRFSDGQKFAAIRVEGDHPELADLVARLLNEHAAKG